jgi:hypothetical protein
LHTSSQIIDTWNFTEIGDARVLGRRQWRAEDAGTHRLDFFGLNFGLKLPTGKHDVQNDEGALAERTLQPGTGTTDVLVGGYFTRMLFRPGTRTSLDLGYRKETSEKLAWMLQLNFLHKARDRGAEAEEEDSGGRFLYLSPGVSYTLTPRFQLYGFLQLPLYQYVNGVQLTADWAVAAGVSARF